MNPDSPFRFVGEPNYPEEYPVNPLNDHPDLRRIAYYVQFVVAGAILLTGIGFAAAAAALPTWYVVTAAVTSGAWSYLGLTAAQNTPSGPARDQRGALDLGTALVLAVLVLLVLVAAGVVGR